MTKNLREGLVFELLMFGNPNDTSGNGNNATVTNATLTTGRFNRDNNAYLSDASGEYLTVSDASQIDLGSGDFAIETWVKIDDITTGTEHRTILAKDTFASGAWLLQVIDDGGGATAKKITFVHNASNIIISNTVWESGDEHHIVITRSGSTLTLYIDGVVDTTGTDGTDYTNAHDLTIGYRLTGGYGPLRGKIDHLRFWDRNITATEAQQLFNEIKGNYQGLFDGLVAAYDFKGDAKDWSGGGNDGTVSGATLTNDRFGIANSAYSFNGTTDYIDLGSNTFDFLADNGVVVINMWMKYSGSSGYRYLYALDGYWFCRFNPSDKIEMTYNDAGNIVTSTSTYNDNTYHMITAVYNGTKGQLYIDGVLDVEATYALFDIAGSTQGQKIGTNTTASSQFHAGTISSTMFWVRSYSADEVKQIYDLESKKDIYTYMRDSN